MHRHADGADGLGVLGSAGLSAARRRRSALLGHRTHRPAKVRAAIAAIPEDAWTPIRYPRAIWDDQLGRWVSDAQVAETEYTAFASRKGQAITARLIVRRVKDLNPKAAAGPGRTVHRLALPRRLHRLAVHDAAGRRTAPRPRPGRAGLRRLDRRPAGPPALGPFPANAAWLALAAISCNLLRAAGALASLAYAKARGATMRRDLINVAARIARHGRGHLTVHLPEGWHREHEWMNLFDAACGPPAAAA